MDWELYPVGFFLTFAGLFGVYLAYAGIAKTFLEGLHSIAGFALAFGVILLVAGTFKGGFPTSPRDRLVVGFTVLLLVASFAVFWVLLA